MAVTDRSLVDVGDRRRRRWSAGGCTLLDLVVGASLAYTDVGSMVLLDSWEPFFLVLAAGLLLGLAQSGWAGARSALLGAAIAAGLAIGPIVVGLWFYVIVFGPSVAALCLGVVVGALIGPVIGVDGRLRVAGAFASVTIVFGVAVLALLPEHPEPALPLLELAQPPDLPTVVVDVEERVHEQEVSGVLGVVGGCWGLVDRPGGAPDAVVVWPLLTEVGTDGTVTAHGRTWVLGDEAALPGVVVDRPVDLAAYAPDLPAGCRDHPLVL